MDGTFAIAVVRPLSTLLTKRAWLGRERIPADGGVIIAANHVSWVDPFALGHFVYSAGRIPRFMAKASLFRQAGDRPDPARRRPDSRAPGGAGRRCRAERRCPGAARRRSRSDLPRRHASRDDPDWWPMQAKTGVARLALMSGAPVIPVAQWGPQEILGRVATAAAISPQDHADSCHGAAASRAAGRGCPTHP